MVVKVDDYPAIVRLVACRCGNEDADSKKLFYNTIFILGLSGSIYKNNNFDNQELINLF